LHLPDFCSRYREAGELRPVGLVNRHARCWPACSSSVSREFIPNAPAATRKVTSAWFCSNVVDVFSAKKVDAVLGYEVDAS
jgi:hypothetical protein